MRILLIAAVSFVVLSTNAEAGPDNNRCNQITSGMQRQMFKEILTRRDIKCPEVTTLCPSQRGYIAWCSEKWYEVYHFSGGKVGDVPGWNVGRTGNGAPL